MNQLFLYKLLQFGSTSILHLQSIWVKWNKLLLKWSCLQQAKKAKNCADEQFLCRVCKCVRSIFNFYDSMRKVSGRKIKHSHRDISCSIASDELITVTGFYCITLIDAACQDEVQVICIAHYEKVVGISIGFTTTLLALM